MSAANLIGLLVGLVLPLATFAVGFLAGRAIGRSRGWQAGFDAADAISKKHEEQRVKIYYDAWKEMGLKYANLLAEREAEQVSQPRQQE